MIVCLIWLFWYPRLAQRYGGRRLFGLVNKKTVAVVQLQRKSIPGSGFTGIYPGLLYADMIHQQVTVFIDFCELNNKNLRYIITYLFVYCLFVFAI